MTDVDDLKARTVWLDPAVDLLGVAGSDGWLFERDRAGLAARGCAARVDASSALSFLKSIPSVDDVNLPGTGPIAVGALPFDSARGGMLTVPSVVVGRTPAGRSWITTLGDATLGTVAAAPAQDPDGFDLSSPVPHAEWMEIVRAAVAAIDRGEFGKVVLAREVLVEANRPIDVPTVLRRLRSLYPSCTVVSTGFAGARFIAASPELLVSRIGPTVRSHPLAGTIPRSGDPLVDDAMAAELLASPKDRAEHDWVVTAVRSALEPWCTSLDVPPAPSIVSFRNVSHLGTHLSGTLRDDGPSALQLVAALHPTPAVGGTPTPAALQWLRANERLDRGPYAGPTGWMDARGDGEWVVGIRSAVVSGRSARLFAGVGVVEGSDPAGELAETQFKLQALLAAVVRP